MQAHCLLTEKGRRNMRKNVMAGLLLLFLGLLFSQTLPVSAKTLKPTEQFYVNDYADVLSEEQENDLCSEGKSLYEKTTAQVVLLTVDTTDGKEISEYAVETGRAWGIGSADKDNGVLIVLSVEDRKVWVAVGYGLEGVLTDAKTGRLIDEHALSYYKEDKFGEGSISLYYAILNEVRAEYGLEAVDTPAYDSQEEDVDIAWWQLIIGIIMILLVIFVPIILIVCGVPFVALLLFRLIRWGVYCLIDGILKKNLSAGYREKNFSWPAIGALAEGCLLWVPRLLDYLDGGDSDGGGGSFGGGGAGRDF